MKGVRATTALIIGFAAMIAPGCGPTSGARCPDAEAARSPKEQAPARTADAQPPSSIDRAAMPKTLEKSTDAGGPESVAVEARSERPPQTQTPVPSGPPVTAAMREAEAARQKLAPTQIKVEAAFVATVPDTERALRMLARYELEPRLIICYVDELRASRNASGDVHFHVVVDPHGHVDLVEAQKRPGPGHLKLARKNTLSNHLVDCAKAKLRELDFSGVFSTSMTVEGHASFAKPASIDVSY